MNWMLRNHNHLDGARHLADLKQGMHHLNFLVQQKAIIGKYSYFEALDLVLQSIKEQFDQPGYHIYYKLEYLLLKAAQNTDYSDELTLSWSAIQMILNLIC